MVNNFTLEYWIDDEWFVGKLKEVPGIFSQGESLEELEENIREVYKLMMKEKNIIPSKNIKEKSIGVEI